MQDFFYMHFGDDVPKDIEKEYNRLLLHEQYLDKREQKFRVQSASYDDVLALCPDPSTLPANEYELEQKRIHDDRLNYLPIALDLLKVEFPDLYCLVIEYYCGDTKVTMAELGRRHGLTAETVRYRIRAAKKKLKAYIIAHEKNQ